MALNAYDDDLPEPRPGGSLGSFVRHWRTAHNMSQERLAAAANTTCRYVSFIENGRATPTRAMLERLAGALGLHARHVDSLFMAAGYVPAPATESPTHDQAHEAEALIGRVLAHHQPCPAIAVDRDWTIVGANQAGERLLRMGAYPPAEQGLVGQNVIDLIMRPDGLRPRIHNWQEYTWRTLQYLHRLWARTGILPATLVRVRQHPDIVEIERMLEPPPRIAPPGSLVLIAAGMHWPFFQLRSRVTTPGTQLEHDLCVELFFPAWDHDPDSQDHASMPFEQPA